MIGFERMEESFYGYTNVLEHFFFQSVEELLSSYAIDIPACYSNRNAVFTITTLYLGTRNQASDLELRTAPASKSSSSPSRPTEQVIFLKEHKGKEQENGVIFQTLAYAKSSREK